MKNAITKSLSSWYNTPTRQAIFDFVSVVSDESNASYMPPEERIATFDNDGTLWCERPFYVQFISAFEFLADLAKANPALRERQPYKAAYERDMDWLSVYTSNKKIPELVGMLLQAAAGETQDEFETRSSHWLHDARHPRFDTLYTQLIYKPMIELLDYLRDHDFRIFICSGGGMDYVRLISEELYGVARENVIGSNMKLAWEYRDEGPVLVRQAGIVEPFNDGAGKPINIQLHVGRPPILAAGNSNGDMAMMEFAAAGKRPFLNLLLRHDDAEREYAYDDSAEKVQQTAQERKWTTISMKNDWQSVF
ncbi:MAG: haloacid dehalogenase-like hydrolase [Chloroflexi bacterium]|nr:haloacid dehalogenase-like hydrolase [Chloroflexota bacterium]